MILEILRTHTGEKILKIDTSPVQSPDEKRKRQKVDKEIL